MSAATVTVPEAAEAIGCSTNTVRALIANGHLRRLPGIRRVLIPRVSLDAYLEGVAA